MKNLAAHIRNFTKLQSNNEDIESNKLRASQKINVLRKELEAIQNKIYLEEGNLANKNSAMIEENEKISSSKAFVAFFQKLQVVFKDLGIKQKDHDKFMQLFRAAFDSKAPFYYYCIADPRKSTSSKPTNLANFRVIDLKEVEVVDRVKKIDNILVNL